MSAWKSLSFSFFMFLSKSYYMKAHLYSRVYEILFSCFDDGKIYCPNLATSNDSYVLNWWAKFMKTYQQCMFYKATDLPLGRKL